MFEQNNNRGKNILAAAFFKGSCLSLFLTLFAALNIPLQAQIKRYTIPPGRESVELPFVKVNNLILVPVMLEGIVPLWFILDTGVRSTILTDRIFTDLLNIEYIRKYTLQAAGNMQQVEAYLTGGTSMKMGEIQIEGEPLLVLEEDYLELSKQLGMQVHGIMGHDIFKRFVVKIDYIKGIVTFIEPEGFRPPRGFRKIPLEVENTKPFIYCEIEEEGSRRKRKLKLMIDTGASHALLLHQNEELQNFKLPEKTIFGHLGRGLAGDVVGEIGRTKGFYLEDFFFEDVLTSFPEDSAYNIQDWNSRSGTLGGDILNRFTVIFDYSKGVLYLRKNINFQDPFIYSRTGLEVIAMGENLHSFKVVGVRKESPAGRAGVQVGDELLRINGRNAKNITLSQLLTIFRRKNGRKVRLRIKRGLEECTAVFRLEDII